MAALQALEVVDAHGVSSLGNCSARRRGDVLRMVFGAIPVVLAMAIFDTLLTNLGSTDRSDAVTARSRRVDN